MDGLAALYHSTRDPLALLDRASGDRIAEMVGSQTFAILQIEQVDFRHGKGLLNKLGRAGDTPLVIHILTIFKIFAIIEITERLCEPFGFPIKSLLP